MPKSPVWKAAAALCALAFLAVGPATAANVIVGNCNQVTQNIEMAEGSTLIVENDCFADDPAESFRVRYFWLDSLSLSFLMAGYADENMQAIAGKAPQMWRGSIYPVLADILRQFGERPTESSNFFLPGYASRLVSRQGIVESQEFSLFENLPAHIRRNLLVYNGTQPILWPDIPAYEEFHHSDRWPSDYRMTYGDNPNSDAYYLEQIEGWTQQAAAAAAICTTLYGWVDRDEFRSYRQNVRQLADQVASGRVGPPTDPLDIERADIGSGASFVSYDAMAYFGADNWPRDFLVKFGRYGVNECAQVAGFGLAVLPRELFVLVAVVEATGRRLELEGFGYNVDPVTGLRADLAPSTPHTETFSFPAMNRGDTVVVPLRIELRYDLDAPPLLYMRRNRVSERFYRGLENLGSIIVLNDGSGIGQYRDKPFSAFRPPQYTTIRRTYYFGEVRDLEEVIIDGNAYAVRDTPRVAMLSVAGYEGASCPFLEFVEADGRPSLHGRVLVGASEASKAMTDSVSVPTGARSIIITEREPEISYLAKITLVETGSGKRRTLARNITLKPWERLEMPVPEEWRDKDLTVEISGYYRPLSPVATASR